MERIACFRNKRNVLVHHKQCLMLKHEMMRGEAGDLKLTWSLNKSVVLPVVEPEDGDHAATAGAANGALSYIQPRKRCTEAYLRSTWRPTCRALFPMGSARTTPMDPLACPRSRSRRTVLEERLDDREGRSLHTNTRPDLPGLEPKMTYSCSRILALYG